jgi:hypothetical protein
MFFTRRTQWIRAAALAFGYFCVTRGALAQEGAFASPVYPGTYGPAPTASGPAFGAPGAATVYAPAPRGPLVLRYQPGVLPPPGYHLEENPRKGLVVAGAMTFGIPYLISLTIGGASRHEADRWLLLPVVGPIGTLTYGMRGCDLDDKAVDCTGNLLIVVGLAFDLAAQMAGATLFTMGYVFPKKQWVSDYGVATGTPPSFAWRMLPRIEREGIVGLTIVGTTP